MTRGFFEIEAAESEDSDEDVAGKNKANIKEAYYRQDELKRRAPGFGEKILEME